MERIVIKLADPAVETDALAQQAAELAGRLPEAEVVRVSGSGRVLLTIPEGTSVEALERLSSLETVAWAEADGTDSAQSGVAEPGVAQSADGDPEPL